MSRLYITCKIISVIIVFFIGNNVLLYGENVKNTTAINTTINSTKKTIDKQTENYKIQQKTDKSEQRREIQQQNALKEFEQSVNMISDNPINIVDNLLKKTSKKLNIAIIAPMTGKYKSIGSMIVESAMLTTHESKYTDSYTINIYNIEQLPEKNWQKNKEIQKFIRDNNDIIIGFAFKDTAKKILSIIPDNKLFINFTNDNSMVKQYPNLIVFSMNDSFKIASLLGYLSANNRQFLSLILPATKKGYSIDKLFRKIASQYKIFIVSSQFYQEKNKISITTSVQTMMRSFKTSYIVNENGNLLTENYKENKARLKQKTQEQQNTENSEQTSEATKIKSAETNAIYVEADEADLITILSILNKNNVLDKNVQIFSNAIFNPSQSNTTNLDAVLFLGYDYQFIDTFNKKFKSYFNQTPNYFAYMTYDAISMLLYVSETHQMLPRYFFSEDGFHGILDDFRFARNGNTERRLGIYKLKNQTISKIYTPFSYLPTIRDK